MSCTELEERERQRERERERRFGLKVVWFLKSLVPANTYPSDPTT